VLRQQDRLILRTFEATIFSLKHLMLISCFNFSVLLLIVILNVLDVSSVCTRRAAADADDNDDNDNDDDDDGDDGGSLQVISRVCVPTFTSNVDCEPTS